MRHGGTLLFEVGIRQAETVRSLLSECGYTEVLGLPEYGNRTRSPGSMKD
jgi:hypothetical protein